jgi:ABC-type uncharacterized transport system involved in gliding motility auxiliary subunit
MELKGKHLYGLVALGVGIVGLLFAGVTALLNQKFDTSVQAGLAVGLLSLALFAWLELDLISRFLRTRQAQYGATAIAYSILILVVVVMVNYIFFNFDKLKGNWDLTEGQQNSLSDETVKFLASVNEPIKVIAFYTANSSSRTTGEDLLKRFQEKSNGNLSYQIVDPDTQPVLAQQYGITADGTLVVTKGSLHENAKFADEGELVNAIARIQNPIQQTVYFVTGHGERSPDSTDNPGYSQVKTYLENVNYQVKTLSNLSAAVPVDASVIVVAGPSKPYSQQDVDNLAKYLSGGGKVIFMIEPSILAGIEAGQTDPLVDYLLKVWGITVRDDVVFDSANFAPGADASFPAAASYNDSPLITPEISRVYSFYPSTRSIEVPAAGKAPEGVIVSPVVLTSSAAFGETNLEALKGTSGQKVEPSPEDPQGVLNLLVTATNSTQQSQIVVVGDADFAANGYWSSQAANPIIFLNAVKWMTARENQVTVSPKPTTDHSLTIGSNRDLIVIFLLSCLLPPLLIVIAGVSVWWSRRRTS